MMQETKTKLSTTENSMTHKKRIGYPSDITNLQWKFVERLLPPEQTQGRSRSTELRDVINAIHYRWKTGCVWRMLPHDFPPWATVYSYFRSWQSAGIISNLREIRLRNKYPLPSNKPTLRLNPINKQNPQTNSPDHWNPKTTHLKKE